MEISTLTYDHRRWRFFSVVVSDRETMSENRFQSLLCKLFPCDERKNNFPLWCENIPYFNLVRAELRGKGTPLSRITDYLLQIQTKWSCFSRFAIAHKECYFSVLVCMNIQREAKLVFGSWSMFVSSLSHFSSILTLRVFPFRYFFRALLFLSAIQCRRSGRIALCAALSCGWLGFYLQFHGPDFVGTAINSSTKSNWNFVDARS